MSKQTLTPLKRYEIDLAKFNGDIIALITYYELTGQVLIATDEEITNQDSH